MRLDRKYSFFKKVAVFVAVNILWETCFPTVALALTGGPSQPEFSSFEPVATTNMVNEFSGDLTYNLPVLQIPGANDGGYAMSLSYHSGAKPEEEASWVGYGWTLNPGSITRGKQGFPDDWKGKEVTYWNKSKTSRTVTVGGSATLEAFSASVPLSLNTNISYNNYKGFGYSAGAGISFKGIVSLGYNFSNGDGSFSLGVNPAALINMSKKAGAEDEKQEAAVEEVRKSGSNEEIKSAIKERSKNQLGSIGMGSLNLVGSDYGVFSGSGATRSLNATPYEGFAYNMTSSVMPTASGLQIGVQGSMTGSYAQQKNKNESENLYAYGYMYSKDAGNTNDMMDYTEEKLSNYNKRDLFLAVPFNTADQFNVSGEAIGGSFRMYMKKVGHFHPNYAKSRTDIFNIGGEIQVGLDFGGGGDVGQGTQTLEVDTWNDLTDFSDPDNYDEEGEPVHFRFKNDPGGYLSYGTFLPQRANVLYKGGERGREEHEPAVGHITNQLNSGERTSRSSYIGFSTNSEIEEKTGGKRYRAYCKDEAVHDFIDRAGSSVDDQIGEVSVLNEDGMQYTYGLPVYSKNEKNLQIDLKGTPAGDFENNYKAYRDITDPDIETKVGEERDAPYATTYLLTSITTPDYVDRTHDGPSADDFGGYTRFVYKRPHGSNTKTSGSWYKWRTPYNGLLYNKNSLSDPEDDLGSVVEGEKEIYYLDSVITKTHVAVFETSGRDDGEDAEHDPATASSDSSASGSNTLQKLDQIRLYSKQDDGTLKLIKTTNFRYDYSLCSGLPNSASGKLTLKKVWFEYEGKVDARISPYKFSYEYPDLADADYPAKYNDLEDYGPDNDNPNYSPFSIDAWGNYQADGAGRFQDMKKWLNQNPSASFDPAAWQLKRITLPSGGEIHVQYEQDDYCYVQNEDAHAMVSLTGNSNDDNGRYYLNHDDLGIQAGTPLTNDSLLEISRVIKSRYVNGGERIYFKFLYKLLGSDSPDINDCISEYISGYVKVQNVGVDNNGIWLKLGEPGHNYTLPQRVCKDFVRTSRQGKLDPLANCNPSESGAISGPDFESIIMNFLSFARAFSPAEDLCGSVNYSKSYLRVPLFEGKKGGGLRVKRLLMYDKGIESGFKSLYGTEYIYKFYDKKRGRYRSSGVAVNEPNPIREENILVGYLRRLRQTWAGRVISGRDKKEAEGPLGETIMPGASVGYSRIIKKNIHSGETNPGFTVTEYLTAKDYPFTRLMTPIDKSKQDQLHLPTGFVNKFINNTWVSQGYTFIKNSMHGKIKSKTTYKGDYEDIYNLNSTAVIKKEEYEYYDPGEDIPVMKSLTSIEDMPMGKEMDMTFATRATKDIMNDKNVEFDAEGGVFGTVVLPLGSFLPTLTYTETELYTHTTSKVVSYPAVLKSVKTYQDGIYHLKEHLAYNKHNGKPVITRSKDGFDELDLLASTNHSGIITDYSIPGSYEYDNLSQAAANIRKKVDGGSSVDIDLVSRSGSYYLTFTPTGSTSVCDAMSNFTPGDLVKVNSSIYHLGEPSGSKIQAFPLSYSSGSTASSVEVEILRSGRSNKLTETAGKFTTYGPDATSTYNYDSIPSSVMTPRRSFANTLNNAITNGDTIRKSDIPSGLKFSGANGCAEFSEDQFILIQGNRLNVYGPDPNQTDTVWEDNHPMVDSLNEYLVRYNFYRLDKGVNQTPFCDSLPVYGESGNVSGPIGFIENISNTRSDVEAMRNSQATMLDHTFTKVNGETRSISDFFEDDGVDLGYTNTVWDTVSNLRTNARVVLSYNNDEKRVGWEPYCIPEMEVTQCGTADSVWSDAVSAAHYIGHKNFNPNCINQCPDLTVDTALPGVGKVDGFAVDMIFNNYGYQPGINDTSGFGEPHPSTSGELLFQQNADNYLTFNFNSCDSPAVFKRIRFYDLTISGYGIKCSSVLQPAGGPGKFDIDVNTGSLVYYPEGNDCYPVSVSCLSFCDEAYPTATIENVIASSSKTYDDDWDFDQSLYYPQSGVSDPYECGEKGKWRVASEYAYRKAIDGLNEPFDPSLNDKNYNSGTYDLELFNWQYLSANSSDKWLELNTVTRYSPNGNAIEEENILGIKSAAKFGYDNTLPYLVVKNSGHNSVLFESFEKSYSLTNYDYGEDGLPFYPSDGQVDNSVAHSGEKSFKLDDHHNGFNLKEYTATGQLLSEGMLAKVWVRSEASAAVIENNFKFQIRDSQGSSVDTEASFSKVARTGEWTLYEAHVNDLSSHYSNGDEFGAYFKYDFTNGGNIDIWVDDVRLQPADAQMTTYVYDVNTLRLLTSFDDQHFGLYYQYNGEGKLVRKLIETERGMRVVKETQYHTPLTENRN